MDDEQFNRYVKYSNISPKTQMTKRLFTLVDRNGTEEALKAALEYTSGAAGHHFITFTGTPGTGKTHLALGIGWQWMEAKGLQVRYWQVEELMDKLRGGMSDNIEERDTFELVLHQAMTTPLLILDDIGAEHSTEWAQAKLNAIVNHRYTEEKYTVFTTQEAPKNLGIRISSRMKEGIVVRMRCLDYRPIIAASRKRSKQEAPVE